jgi:hypothetical protein
MPRETRRIGRQNRVRPGLRLMGQQEAITRTGGIQSPSRCSGPMRWVEAATTAEAICRLLAEHGLAPWPPPPSRTRPRSDGQLSGDQARQPPFHLHLDLSPPVRRPLGGCVLEHTHGLSSTHATASRLARLQPLSMADLRSDSRARGLLIAMLAVTSWS